jgi:hypothetical protein
MRSVRPSPLIRIRLVASIAALAFMASCDTPTITPGIVATVEESARNAEATVAFIDREVGTVDDDSAPVPLWLAKWMRADAESWRALATHLNGETDGE